MSPFQDIKIPVPELLVAQQGGGDISHLQHETNLRESATEIFFFNMSISILGTARQREYRKLSGISGATRRAIYPPDIDKNSANADSAQQGRSNISEHGHLDRE